MSRNRQLKIWSHLIDLLGAHDDGDCTEDGRLKLSSSAAFIGKCSHSPWRVLIILVFRCSSRKCFI